MFEEKLFAGQGRTAQAAACDDNIKVSMTIDPLRYQLASLLLSGRHLELVDLQSICG